jgi:hypothetical protein
MLNALLLPIQQPLLDARRQYLHAAVLHYFYQAAHPQAPAAEACPGRRAISREECRPRLPPSPLLAADLRPPSTAARHGEEPVPQEAALHQRCPLLCRLLLLLLAVSTPPCSVRVLRSRPHDQRCVCRAHPPAACEKAVRAKCTGVKVQAQGETYAAVCFGGAGAAAASCALFFTPLCFGLKSRSSKPVAAAVDKPSWPIKAATSLRSPATSPPPDMGVTKSPSASSSASVAATARRGLREVGTAEGPIPTLRWASGMTASSPRQFSHSETPPRKKHVLR